MSLRKLIAEQYTIVNLSKNRAIMEGHDSPHPGKIWHIKELVQNRHVCFCWIMQNEIISSSA